MNDSYIDKYLICVVKDYDTKIIKVFDNLDDALIYGEENRHKHKLKDGVFCCLFRESRKGFTSEDCQRLHITPYIDRTCETWIDFDELMAYEPPKPKNKKFGRYH